MNPIATTINKLICPPEGRPLTIFTFLNNDQWLNYEWSKLGHTQIIFGDDKWKLSVEKPNSIQFAVNNTLPLYLPDLIVCFDRTSQYALAKNISDASHCPFIIVNTTGPHGLQNHPEFQSLKRRLGFASVFTGSSIRNLWDGVGFTLKNAVDKTIYFPSANPRPEKVILLPPENPQQEMLVRDLSKEYDCTIIGVKTEKELNSQYNSGRVFINLNGPHVPFQVLQAQAAGCVVISVECEEIKDYIEHGKTGFLYKNFGEINNIVKRMMTSEFSKISEEAAKEGDYKQFQEGWSNILISSSVIFYER